MRRSVISLSCLFFLVLAGVPSVGQTQYNVLYSFGASGPSDGDFPAGKLASDKAGNMYGTTKLGGAYGYGTVFQMTPSQGGWTETTLYSFCPQAFPCSDGAYPVAGLIFDSAGNLYGTTSNGGANGQACCWGTIFELSPPSQQGGQWTENVLYTFGGNGDGCDPDSKLIFDASGNLYGTASGCGSSGFIGAGVVFELTPSGNGVWTQSVLYAFCANGHDSCPDGSIPEAGVTFDRSGNLYGTTYAGGEGRQGTVYELSPNVNGQWTQTVLHSFGPSANHPMSAIDVDENGNLYGTVSAGGLSAQQCRSAQTCGGVFKLTKASGQWKPSLFQFNGLNGGNPAAGIFLISSKSIAFGTTLFGGTGGTVFEFRGTKETVLYNFCSQPSCADGSQPGAALISDTSGNLYGTTTKGGAFGQGVVFEIVP
jgi:uncharacterized repeat protein (TIGR03803 family)